MSVILSVNINKTDKTDVRGIVNAMRTGMFFKVHEKPQEGREVRLLMTTPGVGPIVALTY